MTRLMPFILVLNCICIKPAISGGDHDDGRMKAYWHTNTNKSSRYLRHVEIAIISFLVEGAAKYP